MLRPSLVLVVFLALGACTFTGPKGGNPGWKIYKKEHDRPVPTAPAHTGAIELRVTRVFLRREHTVLKTVNWSGWIRATIVSAEALPASELSKAFKLHGRSGKVYETHANPFNAGGAWRGKAGEPVHLPAMVAGELNIWASFDSTSDSAPDELSALEFRGVRLAL